MAVAGRTWQGAATTGVTSLVAPAAGQEAWISQIRIVNSDASNCWLKMWMDFDGTTQDITTIVWPQQTIPSGRIVFDTGLLIVGASGHLYMQAEANSKLTVHCVGVLRT